MLSRPNKTPSRLPHPPSQVSTTRRVLNLAAAALPIRRRAYLRICEEEVKAGPAWPSARRRRSRGPAPPPSEEEPQASAAVGGWRVGGGGAAPSAARRNRTLLLCPPAHPSNNDGAAAAADLVSDFIGPSAHPPAQENKGSVGWRVYFDCLSVQAKQWLPLLLRPRRRRRRRPRRLRPQRPATGRLWFL